MNHTDLLRNAIKLDAKLKVGESAKLPDHIGQEPMFQADDDPFGGNENNRKAAERRLAETAEVTAAPEASNATVAADPGSMTADPGSMTVTLKPVPAVVVPALTKKQQAEAKRLAKAAGKPPADVPAWTPNA